MLEGARGKWREERKQPIQTHHCLCVKSQPICTPQERTGGEGSLGRSVGASEYLALLLFGCQFQHVHLRLAVDSVFYRHANQIFYWVNAEQSLSGPPWGIGCVSVIRLVLSCQAGTSQATKARLFHDPDATTGSGGALGNPSLCSA